MTPAADPKPRTVGVHLTPFAPGCSSLGISDERRWKFLWGALPQPAMRSVLTRLNRAPAEITVETQPNGDLDLLATIHAREDNHQLHLSDADGRAPLAVLWHGMTETEARAELAALTAAGWRPTPSTDRFQEPL
jgi:hypothetical protein